MSLTLERRIFPLSSHIEKGIHAHDFLHDNKAATNVGSMESIVSGYVTQEYYLGSSCDSNVDDSVLIASTGVAMNTCVAAGTFSFRFTSQNGTYVKMRKRC